MHKLKLITEQCWKRIFLGAPIPKVGVLTYYFANFFAENCMKMKMHENAWHPRGSANAEYFKILGTLGLLANVNLVYNINSLV